MRAEDRQPADTWASPTKAIRHKRLTKSAGPDKFISPGSLAYFALGSEGLCLVIYKRGRQIYLAMARCGNCGRANRDGALFCQDCGKSLDGRLVGAPEASAARDVHYDDRPAAPAGAGGQAVSPPRVACAVCGEPTPAGFAFCQHCGARVSPAVEPSAAIPAGRVPIFAPAEPLPAPRREARPQILRGRLIVLRRDGSDGESVPLSGDLFDIGRTEGQRTFPDDLCMATRHARLTATSGGAIVRSLDSVNGVFLQLHEPWDLQSGDVFYVGRELLRFELVPADERDPAPVAEHGVRLFGTLQRESWGRLRQLTVAGTARDVFHLSRSEVRIGREEGDIVFPDDEFMSRRHAVLTRHGSRARLEDQHSSNGTYVRLRGERELKSGDILRIGDQVLRFEGLA